MTCKIYLDLISDGYQLSGFATFALIVGITSLAVWGFAFRWTPTRLFDRLLFRLGFLAAAVSGLTMGWLFISTSYVDYRDLIRLYHADLSHNIDGTIEDYLPSSFDAHRRNESFRIDGVTFSYDPSAYLASFHGMRAGDTPMRNGQFAKIVYVEGKIIRLELCADESGRK